MELKRVRGGKSFIEFPMGNIHNTLPKSVPYFKARFFLCLNYVSLYRIAYLHSVQKKKERTLYEDF